MTTEAAPPQSAAAEPERPRRRALGRLRPWLASVPRGFWFCFLIGTLNACVWAVSTPSFQVPDEAPHAGYVQYFAETGRIPRPLNTVAGRTKSSPEITTAAQGVPFTYSGWPEWSALRSNEAERAVEKPLGRKLEEGAGSAANYPPLYYMLEAIPYKLASSGNFYTRLLVMRLFSALFAGLTAGFCFLFARELVPGSSLAWIAAGTVVAFQPLLAFVSGGVNADALLWAASAALFYTVARGFTRGLTVRAGVAIGAALAVALLAKGTALGFLPAVGFALLLMLWRSPRPERRVALRGALAATAAAAVPFLLWLFVSSVVFHRPAAATTAGLEHAHTGGLREQVSWVWQAYLPRLPFMTPQFDFSVPRVIWFEGIVGRFGYAQYQFPSWFMNVALVVILGIAALTVAGLARGRSALRRRWPEALAYLAIAVCIMVVVGVAGYRLSPPPAPPVLQGRYLLPLIPLFAGAVALAVRAGGRRFGRPIAMAVVVLALAHNVAAIVLSLARYYS